MKEKMLTKEEIIKKLKENSEVLKKYGVKRIGLFGSYVHGTQNPGSDIDLVVEFDLSIFGENFKGLYDAYLGLSSFIEKLFNRKVDILTPDSIKTIRIKKVAKNIKRSIIYA